MGNLFSKKESIKDKLISLENRILKEEYELSGFHLQSSLKSTFNVGVLVIPLISTVCYFNGSSYPMLLCIPTFLILFYYMHEFYLKRRRGSTEKALLQLKEERKLLIERCKSDTDFSIKRSLIDKYEEEENRNTFFDQIIKKKNRPMDSVSEFILGGDPSKMNALICVKCGVHNGMVDPKNDNFKDFHCYSCRHKNVRKEGSDLDLKKRCIA